MSPGSSPHACRDQTRSVHTAAWYGLCQSQWRSVAVLLAIWRFHTQLCSSGSPFLKRVLAEGCTNKQRRRAGLVWLRLSGGYCVPSCAVSERCMLWNGQAGDRQCGYQAVRRLAGISCSPQPACLLVLHSAAFRSFQNASDKQAEELSTKETPIQPIATTKQHDGTPSMSCSNNIETYSTSIHSKFRHPQLNGWCW